MDPEGGREVYHSNINNCVISLVCYVYLLSTFTVFTHFVAVNSSEGNSQFQLHLIVTEQETSIVPKSL